MATEHLNDANAAYKAMIEARREAVKKLIASNIPHNRADLLQIVETIEVLREIIKNENGRTD